MHQFDIYFAGKLMPDADPAQARVQIAKLFKISDEAVEKLFTGKSVRIARAVDMEKAGRYREAFRRFGALIDVLPHQAAATDAQSQQQEATDKEATQAASQPADSNKIDSGNDIKLMPANTGSLEDCAPEVAAQAIPDISALQMAAAGEPLSEQYEVPAAHYDLSGLSLGPANAASLEDCAPEIAVQAIPDISALQMAAAGAPLSEQYEVPEAHYDLSGLSLDPANTGSLEDCHASKPARAIPDISHLALDETPPTASSAKAKDEEA